MTNCRLFLLSISLFTVGCGTYWNNPQPEEESAPKKFICGNAPTEYQVSPYGNNEKGKRLYKQNCVQCHHTDGTDWQQLNLNSVLDRVPSKEWIYNFVQRSDSLIKAGDAYTVQLERLHSGGKHPEFKDLSRNDIDSIFAKVFK